MADDRDEGLASSMMRDQYLYLVIMGVVAIVYGTLHPEQRVLGYVAGGLFIVVGGLLLRWSLRRKRERGWRDGWHGVRASGRMPSASGAGASPPTLR
jgi:hypothetical protein